MNDASLIDERFSVVGQRLLRHHRPADLTLEVAVGVLGVCIILVIILIANRWRQARAVGYHNQQLTVTKAINEANQYLSTDVGCHLADEDSNKPVASGNSILDTVVLDNTLSETKA